MAVYQQLQELKYIPNGTITAGGWAGTRGKVIMDRLGASAEIMPFEEDRIAVAMDLFNQVMQGVWTWNPTSASSEGSSMLDGSSQAGECAQLVSAFKTLVCSPAPYGLGVPATDVRSEQWPSNEDVTLFVVNHAGPVFGLYPNVLKKTWNNLVGMARFEHLYAWGNHKVLRIIVGGRVRYFDPCYNNVYIAAAAEMADYALTDMEMELAGKQPIVTKYKGRSRYGRPIAFGAVGSATPDIIKRGIRTLNNNFPVLVGPL